MRTAKSARELGFTWQDRQRLAQALREVPDKRTSRRLRTVYLVAQQRPIAEVAEVLGVSRQSVYTWLPAYLRNRPLAALAEAPRSGRPPTARVLTPARLLREWRRDPLRLGYTTTGWTVSLLARPRSERSHCPLTPRTMRRRMKAAGLCWKRPRYVSATKALPRAQQKGRLSGDSSTCRPQRSS